MELAKEEPNVSQPPLPESPPLQALRKVWQDFQAQIATPEDVTLVLQANLDVTEVQLEQLAQQIQHTTDSAAKENLQRIRRAFELHFEAVENMWEDFEKEDWDEFEGSFQLAVVANQKLWEAHQLAQQAGSQAEVQFCPFCRQQIRRGVESCPNCSRKLPNAANSESVFDHRENQRIGQLQTENFVQTSKALELWKAGKLSQQECAQRLHRVQDNFQNHLKAINSEPSNHPRRQQTVQLLTDGLEILADLLESLDGTPWEELSESLQDFETVNHDLASIALELTRQEDQR